MKSKNGGAVAELDTGGWSDNVRRHELPLSFSKQEGNEEEKMEWSRGWRPGRGVMARRAQLREPPSDTRTPSTAIGGHATAELCTRSGEAELAVGAGRLRKVDQKGSGGPFWKIKKSFLFFFFKAQHMNLHFLATKIFTS
jgi:hypothetical protein